MSPKKIETLANFKLEAFSFPCGIYQVQPIRHIQITILLLYFGLLNTDRFLSFLNAMYPSFAPYLLMFPNIQSSALRLCSFIS